MSGLYDDDGKTIMAGSPTIGILAANSLIDQVLPRWSQEPTPLVKLALLGRNSLAVHAVQLVLKAIDVLTNAGAYYTSREQRKQLAALCDEFMPKEEAERFFRP